MKLPEVSFFLAMIFLQTLAAYAQIGREIGSYDGSVDRSVQAGIGGRASGSGGKGASNGSASSFSPQPDRAAIGAVPSRQSARSVLGNSPDMQPFGMPAMDETAGATNRIAGTTNKIAGAKKKEGPSYKLTVGSPAASEAPAPSKLKFTGKVTVGGGFGHHAPKSHIQLTQQGGGRRFYGKHRPHLKETMPKMKASKPCDEASSLELCTWL